MTAIEIAALAATNAFDELLRANRSTATQSVPESVITAAKAAYKAAGGEGEIEVTGHGNTTHPVCSVSVRQIKVIAGD